MKNIRVFLSENFHFLVVNFSVNLNRRVFVMYYYFFTYDLDLFLPLCLSVSSGCLYCCVLAYCLEFRIVISLHIV